MSRRKSERPVLRPLKVNSPDSPVVRNIADGTGWFTAWIRQECTPLSSLARVTGIPRTRLDTLCHGRPVSRAEIDALARAWSVSSVGLISTMPDASLVVE